MKKMILALLVLGLLLCGCTRQQSPETTTPPTDAPTQAPSQPSTQPPTEAPTEAPSEAPTQEPTQPPLPVDPLNGQTLQEPYNGRPFAVTINNVIPAMPLVGVGQADLFFEMFVNDLSTRGLAIYSDISQVPAVGSVRSLRYNFTDLCQIYDAVIAHASGSEQVLQDLYASGVPNVNVENEGSGYSFRDQARVNQGYAWEHCLFVRGADLVAYAAGKGVRMDQETERDFGLRFTEDGTPDGEDAATITIDLKHHSVVKNTTMVYDPEAGAYHFYQFGRAMNDGADGSPILFENVIVMLCQVYDEGVYHIAELTGSGEGYFACGGKIIPIFWHRDALSDPITFTLADGTPLELGVGSSYVALAPIGSPIGWE